MRRSAFHHSLAGVLVFSFWQWALAGCLLSPLGGAMGEDKAQRLFECFVEPIGGLNPYVGFLRIAFVRWAPVWKTPELRP